MTNAHKHLLIVAHTPSVNTSKIVDAMLAGASSSEFANVSVRHIPPLQAQPDDVLKSNALILGTTENFGYMSGALKDFFDRIYYPCLDKTQAMPYALVIRAGIDGTGTQRAVESITGGLKWRAAQPTLILQGDYRDSFEQESKDLATWMAAALDAGII